MNEQFTNNLFDQWNYEPEQQDQMLTDLLSAIEYQTRKLINGNGNTTVFNIIVNAYLFYKEAYTV
jgi:hypothetical protein